MVRRAGWNPARRNRNIGTAKQGHGQDNRLTIPDRWPHDRVYWEALRDPIAVIRDVSGQPLTFLVEPARPGFVHACTIDDVCHAWSLIPEADRHDIGLVVFRQPKRKELILAPVWGRLAFYAQIGAHAGTAVFLDATEPGLSLRWDRSMTPEETLELARLRADGHEIVEERRHYLVRTTLASTRATQLYRTLFHEVGHHVDWSASVLVAGDDETSAYDRKPARDKEAFAHRYADELRRRLEDRGALPFERRLDEAQLRAEGLEPAWFGCTSTP